MSIWTELLLFHGHVATPAALALFVPAGTCRATSPAADGNAPAVPEPPVPPPAGGPYHHALRAVGQLR
jgi:hypothetical protein